MIRSPFTIKPKTPKPADLAGGLEDLLKIQKVLSDLESFKKIAQQQHEQKLAEMDGHIATAHAHLKRAERIQQGIPGRPGEKGDSIKGEKGEPGTPPTPSDVAAVLKTEVIESLKPLIPPPVQGEAGKNAEPLDPMAIIELIKEKKLIKAEHIQGLNTEIQRGVVRGGGDTIAAGTGVTISQSNGVKTINALGGAGFTALTATETPNSNLKVFTFAAATAQPTYLVIDNVWQKAVSAAGTVNWTWNNGTKQATLAVPPVDDVWGVV